MGLPPSRRHAFSTPRKYLHGLTRLAATQDVRFGGYTLLTGAHPTHPNTTTLPSSPSPSQSAVTHKDGSQWQDSNSLGDSESARAFVGVRLAKAELLLMLAAMAGRLGVGLTVRIFDTMRE